MGVVLAVDAQRVKKPKPPKKKLLAKKIRK
jgi:hypothetical protein